ncbi:MAG: hypothetical protein LUC89_02765 [Oscillospiraceae bacterium]|nr:hypothetical protein [Oscillospiraceae bacterium]
MKNLSYGRSWHIMGSGTLLSDDVLPDSLGAGSLFFPSAETEYTSFKASAFGIYWSPDGFYDIIDIV